ncbi:MAG: hypothetical protein GY853_00860 [PVC group bacterium]|nr:hypothetical protein [PVC group bacterium]
MNNRNLNEYLEIIRRYTAEWPGKDWSWVKLVYWPINDWEASENNDFPEIFKGYIPTNFEIVVSMNEDGSFVDEPLKEIVIYWEYREMDGWLEWYSNNSVSMSDVRMEIVGRNRLNQIRNYLTDEEYDDAYEKMLRLWDLECSICAKDITLEDMRACDVFQFADYEIFRVCKNYQNDFHQWEIERRIAEYEENKKAPFEVI